MLSFKWHRWLTVSLKMLHFWQTLSWWCEPFYLLKTIKEVGSILAVMGSPPKRGNPGTFPVSPQRILPPTDSFMILAGSSHKPTISHWLLAPIGWAWGKHPAVVIIYLHLPTGILITPLGLWVDLIETSKDSVLRPPVVCALLSLSNVYQGDCHTVYNLYVPVKKYITI